MTLLSAAQVDAMRAVMAQSYPDTAVIKTQTYTSDGGGGGTTVWAASGTVDCRVAPAPRISSEEEHGDRISPDAKWVITLPAETTITRESRIVVDSVTYSVSGINAPRSWEISRRVEADEVV